MADYGDAVLKRHHSEGKTWVTVESADPVIGISLTLLAEAGGSFPVDDEGCIFLCGYPEHRYKPVRFAAHFGLGGGPAAVLVCERVDGGD